MEQLLFLTSDASDAISPQSSDKRHDPCVFRILCNHANVVNCRQRHARYRIDRSDSCNWRCPVAQ